MKRFTQFFKSKSKKVLLAAALVAVTIGVGGVANAGFGPDRPTKPWVQGTSGFDHVTFNSFTGVPNIGDERNFMTGKINNGPVGFYDPMNQVRDGNELLVRVYVHNNADSSLNDNNKLGVAKNTKVRVEVPENALANAHQMKGYVSADNAVPQTITDTLDVNANYPFQFDYVEGSARIDSNTLRDVPLSDEITRGGVLIGDTPALNGEMKGCFEYVAVVTYKVKIKAPNYTVAKTVRNEGEDSTKWRENAQVKPGENVEWKIEFKNTGATQLNDVAILDQLPKGTSIVPGTTKIYNATNPGGVAAGTDGVVTNGINVGNYTPTSNSIVVFKAKIGNKNEFECGTTHLINKAFAKPNTQGTVTDDASVDVIRTEDCDETPPYYACDLLTVTKGANRTATYKVSATARDGATIKNYTFDFGDGKGLTTDKDTTTYTYEKDGQYTARVKVNVEVDGKVVSVDGDKCVATVSYTPPECVDNPNTPQNECKPVCVDNPNTPMNECNPTTPGGKLPETGPADVAAIAALVTVASSAVFYAISRRNG